MPETPFEAPSVESIAVLLPAFEVHSLIAQGGMGAVYKARQRSLDRDVAVKILPRELCEDPEFRESFKAEAKAMARLIHPNLIGVFDSGNVDGLLYIVMEMVPGKSLYHSAYQQVIDPQQAAEIIIGVCKGLAHAHENGIIHRDIKPANILLTPKAEPKIGDFGLARSAGPDSQGIVMGTPGYTAPEVLTQPDQTDKSSDIFSVGVVLQELLTGAPPESDTPGTPITDPTLTRICSKATHESPAMRFADAQAMADALEKWMKAKAAGASAAPYVPPAPKFESTPPTNWPLLRNLLIIVFLLGVISLAWMGLQKKKDTIAEAEPEKSTAPVNQSPDSSTETPPTDPPEIDQKKPQTMASIKPETGTDKTPAITKDPTPKVPSSQTSSLEKLQVPLRNGKRNEMPDGTIANGDKLYFFVAEPMAWIAAHRFAGRHGAHLPLIKGQADIDWLKSNMPETEPGELEYSESWIGTRSLDAIWQSVDGHIWKDSPPQGSGPFAAIDDNGKIVAREGRIRRPFFIEWHRSGKNPTKLEEMLMKTATTLESADPVFPFSTTRREDHQTIIIWRQLAAAEALRLAELGGGRLMEPSTPKDADWLHQRLSKNGAKKGFWLGGRLRSGNWEWLSGAPWDFDRWSDGNPSGTADALAFVPGTGWASLDSSQRIAGFVIEWDLIEIPEEMDSSPELEEIRDLPQDELTVKAGELLRNYDNERKKELKSNSKDYLFKLGVWVKGGGTDSGVRKRKKSVEYLKAHEDSNRIPEGIPSEPCDLFPEGLLEIAQTYLDKQLAIDSSFTTKAATARKFYITKLQTAAGELITSGDQKTANAYLKRIKAASNIDIWVSSFDGLSTEHPKFPAFIITSADFGVRERTADVTARFTELFFGDKERFRVDYNSLQADPAPGVLKTLTVHFIANGISGNRAWRAREMISPKALLAELGLNPDDISRTLDPK